MATITIRLRRMIINSGIFIEMSDSVTVNQYRFLRDYVGNYVGRRPIFESRKITMNIYDLWEVIIRNIIALWPYTGPQGKVFREGDAIYAGDERFVVADDFPKVLAPSLLKGPKRWPFYDHVKRAVLLDEELENDTQREITYARVLMEVALHCKNHGEGNVDEKILKDVLKQAIQYYDRIIYDSQKAPLDPPSGSAPNLSAEQLGKAKNKWDALMKKQRNNSARERAEREALKEAARAAAAAEELEMKANWERFMRGRPADAKGGAAAQTRRRKHGRRPKKTRRHLAKVLSRKE